MKQIKILGHQIPIIYEKDLLREHSKFGHYDPKKQEIKIDADMNKQQQNTTLLHEIIEVIDSALQLNLDHDKQLSKLEVGLYQVLKDNPGLLKLLG